MPNVLIIGAKGYIGSALCQQLLRSGEHQVFGLAKSEKDGFELALNEIIPLRGNIQEPKGCLELISSAKLDVIVDTTSFNDKSTKPKLLEAIIGAAKDRDTLLSARQTLKGPKLGFVTVSGIWSQGSTEDPHGTLEPATAESRDITPPADLAKFKALYEQTVLNAREVLDVAIIRPSFVFGKGGASWTRILKGIFDASQSGSLDTVRIPVDPKNSVYSFTNIDDVASGIELAIDKIQLINGTSVYPVFDLVGDQFPIELLFEKDAGYFGCKGKLELYKPQGVSFLDSIGGVSDVNAVRAKQILGWEARKRHFVRDTHIYAHSFLAAQALAKKT